MLALVQLWSNASKVAIPAQRPRYLLMHPHPHIAPPELSRRDLPSQRPIAAVDYDPKETRGVHLII